MTRISQALVVCAASLLGSLVLGLGRGWPAVPARAAAAEEVAACEAAAEPGTAEIQWITQEDARAFVGAPDVAFVDCRSRELFEEGHVAGSLHVPTGHDTPSETALAALRPMSTVITYCDAGSSCQRSVRLASILMQAGLTDVRVLEGGMPAWLDNGYPAESGSCRLCEDHGLPE